MSQPSASIGELPTSDRARLEQVVERFESAWQRGERPAIDAYLAAEVNYRLLLLAELIWSAASRPGCRRGPRPTWLATPSWPPSPRWPLS